mgnify:CR=1 FL=1
MQSTFNPRIRRSSSAAGLAQSSSPISFVSIRGAQAADRILKSAGLYEVRIEHIAGSLTDHYDPRTKVLRLSDSVYGSAPAGILLGMPLYPYVSFPAAEAH